MAVGDRAGNLKYTTVSPKLTNCLSYLPVFWLNLKSNFAIALPACILIIS